MSTNETAARRLELAGEQVEVLTQGDGEPVLFVHGGVFSDWFSPVAASPALRHLRRILVRRAGYLRGVVPTRPLSVADHARHCALLLDALGLSSAHVCGHSAGALTAIQLTLDSPQLVRSLILLEPAPAGSLTTPDETAAAGAMLGPVFAALAAGDLDTAFDSFLTAVGGLGARQLVETQLGPDGLAAAVEQTVSLAHDGPAVAGWQFTATDAARIDQPMLLVRGGSSEEAPFAPRTVEALAAMVPRAEVVTVPGVTHLMPLQAPATIAELIASFLTTTGGTPAGGATS